MAPRSRRRSWTGLLVALLYLSGGVFSACQPVPATAVPTIVPEYQWATPTQASGAATKTPLPTRPGYDPGQLVDYTAQTGDTIPALAARFNTTEAEIMAANPIIPQSATTMPPGLPMEIPIYYSAFWGTPFQVLPDSHFINGPAAADFDTTAFVNQFPGWLSTHVEYAGGQNRTGAEVVDYVATNFSVSPRLLLAILEHQGGALSQPSISPERMVYLLGYEHFNNQGMYLQLVWAANTLNHGYYSWRGGLMTSFDRLDGRLEQPDPWQNAATVGVQYYFSRTLTGTLYEDAISPAGLAQTFLQMFGDPWLDDQPHIPGSLTQPALTLPFLPGKTWSYTGGPHTGFGSAQPWAAIDFAPSSYESGCVPSSEWVTAMADGVVVRSTTGVVVLDLDGDGDERTGWVIFYLHVATQDRPAVGTELKAGERIGYPSCEGGTSTGTHIHIARKYNGEWVLAAGPLAFNMAGWVVGFGASPYEGTLTRFGEIVIACDCGNRESLVTADP